MLRPNFFYNALIVQKIKLFLKSFWSVILLGLISYLVFFLNYTPGTWLLGWDNLVPEFNFALNIKRALFAGWQEYQGLGLAGGMAHGASLSREIFLWLISPLIPIQFTRYFWTLLMLILGPVGVWFFTRFIFSQKDIEENSYHSSKIKDISKFQLASFISGIFYLFNLATLQYFYPPFETFSSFYGFLPWLIYTSLVFLKSGRKKHSFILLITSFFATSAFQVQTLFIVYILIMGVFLLEVFFRKSWGYKKRVFQWLGITLVANLFWLIPVSYFTIFHSSVNLMAKQNQLATPELLVMNKNFGDWKDILSLKGYWFEYLDQTTQGELEYFLLPWREYLADESLLWIARGLTISGFLGSILLALLYRKKLFAKSFIIFPFSIFLLLTAGKGSAGKIYDFFQNNIPLFEQIFRTTFTKWSVAFAFFIAIGIGFLFHLIQQKLYKWLRLFWISGVIFLMVIVVAPFFRGELIYQKMKVDLPTEYNQLFSFFNDQPKQARIALLPAESIWGWDIYDWGYRGSGFLWYGIEQPILSRAFDVFSPFDETFYHQFFESLRSRDSEELTRILDIYDVGYLLVDTSLIKDSLKEEKQTDYKNIFENIGYEQVFSEGKLIVWENKNISNSFIKIPDEFDVLLTADSFQTRNISSNSQSFISPIASDNSFQQWIFSDVTKQKLSEMNRSDELISFNRKFYLAEKGNNKLIIPKWEKGEKITVIGKISLEDGIVSVNFAPPARFAVGSESFVLADLGQYELEYDPGNVIEQMVFEFNEQMIVINNKTTIDFPFFEATVGEPLQISVNEILNGDMERGFFLKSNGTLDLEIEDSIWDSWLEEQVFELSLEAGSHDIILDIPYISLDLLPFLENSPLVNCDVFERGDISKTLLSGLPGIFYQAKNSGTVCANLDLADIDFSKSYILSVTGNSVLGRPPKFLVNSSTDNFVYLQNLTDKGSFSENYALLSNQNEQENYFINLELKSFGEDVAETTINNMELLDFSFPLDILSKVYLESEDYSVTVNDGINIVPGTDKKIGTSFYKMRVDVTSDDGLLTLSQGFDDGWISFSLNEKIRVFPHTIYNGWANAWVIPEGNQIIYIVYWPQVVIFLGLGLFILITCLFLISTKKKSRIDTLRSKKYPSKESFEEFSE